MSLFDDASLILTPNDYKVGKAYSLKPFDRSGDFTVVRNTTATYRDENGVIQTALANVPRLNYPIGGGCPSWLIEPQATNLVTTSEDFVSNAWFNSKRRVILEANSTTSPNGNLTATKFISTNENNAHYIRRGTPDYSDAVTRTFSVFLKYGNEQKEITVLYQNKNVIVQFNSNGILSRVSNTASFYKIEDYGNGWYKVIISDTVSGGSFLYTGIQTENDQDGTSFFYAWGAQLEQGSLSSYIPTTTSAVTRNADIAGNSNISNLLNSDEGTLFFHVKDVFSFNYTSKILGIDDGGAVSNFFGLYVANPNNGMVSIRNRQANADLTNNVINDASNIKVAIKFGSFGLKTYLNGSLFSSSTTPYSGFATNLNIAIENNAFFKLENLMLFQTALSDTQLQEITTI